MKKIIGILLLSFLAFAEQNSTIDNKNEYIYDKELIESKIKSLTAENKKLQNDIKNLKLENKIEIKSVPEIKLSVKQPVNWYLILLPITTIVIVIIGFLITRRQLINTSKETMNTLTLTLEHEKEKANKELINNHKQIWINELRDEILKYNSILEKIVRTDNDKQDKNTLTNLSEQRLKIDFLLNTNEKKHKLLDEANINAVTIIIKLLEDATKDRDMADFYKQTKAIMKLTKEIIAEERQSMVV